MELIPEGYFEGDRKGVDQRPKELFSFPVSGIFATNHGILCSKYKKPKSKSKNKNKKKKKKRDGHFPLSPFARLHFRGVIVNLKHALGNVCFWEDSSSSHEELKGTLTMNNLSN